jgi:ethanolamine utilization protein EutN
MVVGTIVSTRKNESLVGSKFLEVQVYEAGKPTSRHVIAIDTVGAGIGEIVLITTGSGARLALHNKETPTDAVVVGIVD